MHEGLIGAAIGAFAAILAQIVTNELGGRRERRKEIRERVVSFATAMGAAQQSMEWITWFGKCYRAPAGESCVEPPDVEEYKETCLDYEKKMDELAVLYESEMKDIWPRILGGIAALASYDSKLHGGADGLARELAVYDLRIARANMKKEDRCRADHKALYVEIRDFGETWMNKLANEMRIIGDQETIPGTAEEMPH
jgi:hypothetical protein